jgi:predicted dehydrogenase
MAGFTTIRKGDGSEESLEAVHGQRKPYAVTHNFIELVQSKTGNGGKESNVVENLAPGEVGWRVVEILDAAYRSVQENGRSIEIKELYP